MATSGASDQSAKTATERTAVRVADDAKVAAIAKKVRERDADLRRRLAK